jgi:mitogen-activated protein kinase 1/3
MRKLPNKPPVPLSEQFPGTPSEALDLMAKMLTIHPQKRITVEQSLSHPFFAQLHSPEDEPVAERPFDFTFEDEKLHRVRLQELIWQEVGDLRPACLPIGPRRGGTKSKRRSPHDRALHEA